MNINRKIEVTVNNEGEVNVEAVGYTGGSCTLATQPLTKALIGTPTSHLKKPEYHQGDFQARVQEME